MPGANVVREKLHGYMVGICKNLGCPSLRIGRVEDHVHLLTRHSKTISISDFLHDLKISSSTWIKTQKSTLASFHWQNGYGAFSISPNHLEDVTAYIINQKAHHQKYSFKDEFRRLCKKYDVEIDERYAWD